MDEGVWQDREMVHALGKERVKLQNTIDIFNGLETILSDAKELLQLSIEEKDSGALLDVVREADKIEKKIDAIELSFIFSGEMDSNNAYVDIQSGSGGTEAQDWAEMLLRMYIKFGDMHGFTTELIEVSPAEVAGIKSATIRFIGEHAYGWLRTETGVHRLVRKSPFDSGNKRHTSFASVFVSPEIDDDVEIEVSQTDLRVDTYRAQGAGGQHINTTDSAVRITHIPTGVVVQCQNERSQHKNRAQAMKQLRAKLYELEMRKRNAEKQVLEDSKKSITWGNQIRSYVLDDSRVKDLRVNIETRDTQAILDGKLDIFIIPNLKKR